METFECILAKERPGSLVRERGKVSKKMRLRLRWFYL